MTNVGVRFKDFAITKADESAGYHFRGYASTYGNEDRDGDVMIKGCFDESVKNKNHVTMLFNHDRNKALGRMDLILDDKGLIAEGTFLLDDPEAKKIKGLIDMGALDSMSIGFIIQDYEPVDNTRPFGGWKIKSATVVEVSIVTVPANEQALITEVKSMYLDTMKDSLKNAAKELETEKSLLEEKTQKLNEKKQMILNLLK